MEKNIEETANPYTFIGSMKKPFTILTWLAPKSMAATAGSSDSSDTGSQNAEATGTSGYLFYENQDGYNFKSIDGLVSELKQSEGSSDKKAYQDIFTVEKLSRKTVQMIRLLNLYLKKIST